MKSPEGGFIGQGNALRLLLLDTTRWPLGGRLAARFIALGCEVATVRLARGYPSDTLAQVRTRYGYRGSDPLRLIRGAMRDFQPDLVIPVCDRSISHLQRLHVWAHAHGEQKIAACIERSIGPSESYRTVASRYDLLRMAAEEGIRIPDMQPVRGEDDLRTFAAAHPFPWVIKADGSWGGQGVVQVHNFEHARHTYTHLGHRPGVTSLLSRLATNRDWPLHYGDWRRPAPALLAQSWIAGWPANCAVVCWKGEVLAGIAVEVKATASATGPSRMVEVVDGAEMLSAAKRIAARLQLSGFFGLDFMIDQDTCAPYLIEMNGRCTPICALQLGKGRNLPEALYARVKGAAEPEGAPCTTLTKIAYFPQQQWGRTKPADAAPDWYYDIPLEAPEMIEILLHPWRERSLFGMLVDRSIAGRKEQNGVRKIGSNPQQESGTA